MKHVILIFFCLVVIDSACSQVPDTIWKHFEHISYDSIKETGYLEQIMPYYINLFDSLSNDNGLKSLVSSYNNILNAPCHPDNYTIEEWGKEIEKAFVIRDLLAEYLFRLDEEKSMKIIRSILQ